MGKEKCGEKKRDTGIKIVCRFVYTFKSSDLGKVTFLGLSFLTYKIGMTPYGGILRTRQNRGIRTSSKALEMSSQ